MIGEMRKEVIHSTKAGDSINFHMDIKDPNFFRYQQREFIQNLLLNNPHVRSALSILRMKHGYDSFDELLALHYDECLYCAMTALEFQGKQVEKALRTEMARRINVLCAKGCESTCGK